MFAHPFHQFGPLDAHFIAWPVVDFSGSHQLTANFDASDNHRSEVGTRGIDGGAVTGWAGTDDDDRGVAFAGHNVAFSILVDADISMTRALAKGEA
jgi:hypothetical protein